MALRLRQIWNPATSIVLRDDLPDNLLVILSEFAHNRSTIIKTSGPHFNSAISKTLRWQFTITVSIASCFAAYAAFAGDDDDALTKKRELLAMQRFNVMYQQVTAADVRSQESGFPVRFAEKPLFKYSDPARGYVAAAVWKLGEKGRPKAFVVSELIPKTFGKPCISYEYISLTKTAFTISSIDMNWSPSSTLFEFKPIRGSDAPEKTVARRLIQMRDITKRISCREVDKNQKCELRLLPQPIDRYTPSSDANADGAVFLYSFGTNPEVMLLLESDGKNWFYAAGRMTGAEDVTLTIDDVDEWKGSPVQPGATSPYTGSIAAIDIPGIAKDGSEIKE